MGRRLGCSPRTVEKRLEHVHRKLAVRDRVNAIRVARYLGLRSDAGRNGAPTAKARSVASLI